MIRQAISMYLPSYPRTLVYMLQSEEYRTRPYLAWLWRTKDFTRVVQRRKLERTRPARLLLLALQVGIGLQIIAGVVLIYLGATHHVVGGVVFGLALLISYPLLWAHLIVLPLILGRVLFIMPTEQQAIYESTTIFSNHPGKKLAITGSYGKTSMKELLKTVLSQGLKVAATPANKNVSRSHALFAKKLTGKEDVLIIEYGEGGPGDVARFARTTQPTHAVITGLAPAHLDHYKTLQAAGEDIFSVADYLKGQQVYVNGDSPSVKPFLKDLYEVFDHNGALGWKTANISVRLDGTDFELTKDKKTLKLHSALVGRHQVGYLAFAAALALQFGLSDQQVTEGIAKTKPFEHRMQPYTLGGAWIVDDTYNGNLEGIRAGTQLLSDIDAKRKIYVTPGLVDQGDETRHIHEQVGELIAKAKPDLVVLMHNSVTEFIEKGLTKGNYRGQIQIEDDPLEFYTNLTHFVAHGDLVVMQNDWTDNYA